MCFFIYVMVTAWVWGLCAAHPMYVAAQKRDGEVTLANLSVEEKCTGHSPSLSLLYIYIYICMYIFKP